MIEGRGLAASTLIQNTNTTSAHPGPTPRKEPRSGDSEFPLETREGRIQKGHSSGQLMRQTRWRARSRSRWSAPVPAAKKVRRSSPSAKADRPAEKPTVFSAGTQRTLRFLDHEGGNCHASRVCARPTILLSLGPMWDIQNATAEVERGIMKECKPISFTEMPHAIGLPSYHTDHWFPRASA